MKETVTLCQFVAFGALKQVTNVGSVLIMTSALDAKIESTKSKLRQQYQPRKVTKINCNP